MTEMRNHTKLHRSGYFWANGVKKDGIWNCKHCDEKFPFRRTLQQHLEQQHLEKLEGLGMCDICGKKLRGKALKLHILEHKGPVQCPQCHKMYSTKTSLDIHVKFQHGDIRLIVCDVCGMKVKTKQMLKRHINGVHKKLRRYQCEECKDRFLSTANLRTHCKGRHGGFKDSMMKVTFIGISK